MTMLRAGRRPKLRIFLLAANVVAAGCLLLEIDRSGSIAAPAGAGGRADLEVPPGFVGVFSGMILVNP